MEIKKANKNQIKEIAKLMLKEFSKSPYNEKATINSVTKSLEFYFDIGQVYVLIDNEKITGIIIFKIETYWEGKVIIIEDLISDGLIDFVEDYAKKNNIKGIYFNTNKKSKEVKKYKNRRYKINKNIIFMGKKIK